MKFLAVATLAFMSLAASQSETQRTVDRWQRRIQQSSELLKAGSYEKALRIADDLVNEMVERLGPGDAETESFGIVLVHKALAHAGLGHEQEAIWYWHLAIDLYKDLAAADL